MLGFEHGFDEERKNFVFNSIVKKSIFCHFMTNKTTENNIVGFIFIQEILFIKYMPKCILKNEYVLINLLFKYRAVNVLSPSSMVNYLFNVITQHFLREKNALDWI